MIRLTTEKDGRKGEAEVDISGANSPLFMEEERDGRDKIKHGLADCLRFCRISESSTGKEISAQNKDAVISPIGAVLYFEIDTIKTTDEVKKFGISIEVPSFGLLGPGEYQILPSKSGWFLVQLSNGKSLEAYFNDKNNTWTIGKNKVGEMSKIHLPEWRTPGIITGISRKGDFDPSTVHTNDEVSVSGSSGETVRAEYVQKPKDDL